MLLKKLTIQNFVHFPEEQTFEFRGSYFFIGGNRSGKSCTFEAVRRCMSTSKNFFMSTSHNKAEPSYVICEYVSDYGTDKECKTIYSCVISDPDENEINVKLVIEKSNDNKIYVDLVKKNRHGYPVNMDFPVKDAKYVGPVKTLMATQISIDSLKAFVFNAIINTELYRSFVSETKERDIIEKTACETYLRETIDEEVVITEPMRSVNFEQWSNSPKFKREERKPGNNDMKFKSEIIEWYLENQNTSIEDDEVKEVSELFDYLTEGSQIRFQANREGTLEVFDNGNVVTLEKAPEGLLEAQICAILFSVKQFKTLCLEEPGKGMHTQMIERLRDLALKKGQKKTIIMITHIPAFLNTWNIEKIFFFRRTSDQNGRPLFKAIHGNDIFPRNEQRSRRISADYSLSTIFFATRVLLVEGRSDERFISAVKSILLDDRVLAKSVLRHVLPSDISDKDVDAFYRFLSSLQVLPLNGHPNKLRFEQICTKLSLERYFMLDYDAILDSKKSTSTSKFFCDFELKNLEDEFSLEGVKVLEPKGIFVWTKPSPDSEIKNQKGGTIEDALIQLMNKVGEEMKELFTINHVVLNWEYRENNDKKLFEDRDLTDDNVAEVVLAVIGSCLNHRDSDVFRLLKFLVRVTLSL